MAVVIRGWSRTASTAVKLATAERIIGYPFKDVHRLYEALDQSKRAVALPKGKKTRLRPSNTRLALVGDAHARLYMTQKWYNKQDLTGVDWSKIATSTLSNGSFGHFGFKLGLDECAIPNRIDSHYDMATTVEAIFAAVQMDGADLEQFHKVMVRFGLEHKLVEPVQRAWIYNAVKSKLSLSDRFFLGHHFKLQECVFETQMKRSTAQREKTRSRGHANSLWRRIKKSWTGIKSMWLGPRGNHGKPEWILPAKRQKPLLESATRSPDIAEPLVEGPRPTVTGTIIAASKDVATGETKVLSKKSLSRSEGDTSADDTKTTASDSQDSNKASTDAPEPNPPAKDNAVSGAEMEAEPVEVMEAGDSPEKLKRLVQKLENKYKRLGDELREMELAFRDLNLAKKKKTPEQGRQLNNLKLHRKQVAQRLSMLKEKLVGQEKVV